MDQIELCITLLCSLSLAAGTGPACPIATSGVNVYVDSELNVVGQFERFLPELPDGTPSISYGHVHNCSRFKGKIIVGGTLSMGIGDAYYSQSRMIRRSIQIFLDWLNGERGGIMINGENYSMHVRWTDDASSKQQVTRAMAHAIRGEDGVLMADFAFSGYSSGLTTYAARQSAANNRLLMAGTAASTSAFLHNNLTFGTEGPADTWVDVAVQAVKAASEKHIADSGSQKLGRLRGTQSLKFGLIQADAVFTRDVCSKTPGFVQNAGMQISAAGTLTVHSNPQVEDVMEVLELFQDDGVNALIGCTYYDTGLAIIAALERLDYSPFAVVLTATVALPGYASLVARGWWQGEYFLGVSPWHEKLPGRGQFSHMTSEEFAEKYRVRYDAEVAYQGASQFASCVALGAAIEAAGSLNTQKVATALQTLRLKEFFGEIGFDSNGQNKDISNLVLQYAAGKTEEDIVYPESAVTSGKLLYPMPTWKQRRCRVMGPGRSWRDSITVSTEEVASECSGNGLCNEEGLCVCDGDWEGDSCSHVKTVEETGLPAWGTALIVIGVIIIGAVLFWALCRYKNRHIRTQGKIIEDIQKELQGLKDSVVGMRSVAIDWAPGQNGSSAAVLAPKQRAIWFWAEDLGRMKSHNVNLTMAPHWVQYAGSVAAELEAQYTLYQSGTAEATYATDLTDRISSTGTEAKSYGQGSGSRYIIDFSRMKQINASSLYARDILRHLADAGELSAAPVASGRTSATDVQLPSELQPKLVLKVGSLVQVSKQRPDGWAFGNVIFQADEHYSMEFGDSISFDAGWFPLDRTTLPTKDALLQLKKMMGPAGADCLETPSTWSDLKDQLEVELITLSDGPEKKRVVEWFMKTLSPPISVVRVERIQNLSLWQTFAVKRQTVLSREGTGSRPLGQTSDLERVWLFHGTTADIVPKITQQGFNRSFCGRNATLWGKGVYFARDASYSTSAAYSKPDASNVQRMFLCRVVVGEYCQGVRDALTPGMRDTTKHLLYDSTVDNTRDPSIYVTYHDAQAYPEYLVHFRQ